MKLLRLEIFFYANLTLNGQNNPLYFFNKKTLKVIMMKVVKV